MTLEPVHILLVEDNPLDAAVANRMLDMLGAELPVTPTHVVNAEKAFEEMARAHYDLMLLDYQLPGVNGIEVLHRIHGLPRDRQPAVIMMTASGSEAVAVEAMKQGAKDYLVKGALDVPSLRRAITSALIQKQLETEVARYNEQMAMDLKMARELQFALLPHRFPVFPPEAAPERSLLKFYPVYIPATTLAGDFFDVFALSDHEAGVLICDVMGHGVRAALVTAMMSVLEGRDRAAAAAEPGLFLQKLNAGLLEILRHTDQLLLTTAFYLVVDLRRGELRCADAGHPRPFHLRGRTGRVERIHCAAGAVLGLTEGTYPTTTISVEEGDLLVLFTDGVFEVADENGREYGEECLQAALQRRAALSPASLFAETLDEARAFSATKEFNDDVCLLGIEIGGFARE